MSRSATFIALSSLAIIVPLHIAAQPQAGFISPPTACLNGAIEFQNTSTSASNYVWDFCHEDLAADPLVSNVLNLPTTGSFFYTAIRIVPTGGSWIGFATDINGRKLLRLNFDSDVTSSPIVSNLGDLGGLLTSPGTLDIIEQGGVWYIFILNVFQNKVVRVTMGNGLQSPPTLTEDLGNLGASLSTPIGIKALYSGTNYVLFISNLGDNRITLINFGSSFSGSPVGNQFFTDPLITDPSGIDLISTGTDWYGVVSGFGGSGKTVLISFGADIFNSPTITDLGTVPNGREARLVKEGLTYSAFIRSQNNGLYRAQFGSDFTSPLLARLSTNQLQNDSRSIEIIKDTPNWRGYTIEATTGKLLRLDFVGNCQSSITTNSSIEPEPKNLKYLSPGDYNLELTAFDQNNIRDVDSRIIIISSDLAPEGSIVTDPGQCTGVNKTFELSSENTLISYLWNFGDSNSSPTNPTSHNYGSPATYEVSVSVVDQNTCENSFTTIIKIYDPPVPLFNIPTGLVCTNNEFNFTNNTLDNFDGNLTYQWFVSDGPVGTTRDLIYSFPTSGDADIKLVTSIPGCFAEMTQTLNGIQDGPIVDFDFVGKCEAEIIQFTNLSTGDILGFNWDFGDGQASAQEDAAHPYPIFGSYDVSLVANSSNGCQNSKVKTVPIYSLPQPDFAIDLPPFSCSGSPSQFNDLTANPTDSNLTEWLWNFGDPSVGTSAQRHPTYTYANAGPYTVSLQVTTNFGCVATSEKTVQIALSPISDFTFGPTCLNQSTTFTSLVDPTIQSWLWKIGSTTHAVANPVHVFGSTGDVIVQLTTTGSNNCVAIQSKTITVPVPPALNFLVENNCSGQQTIFKDITPVGLDGATAWVWDFAGKGASIESPAQFLFTDPGVYAVKMTTTHASGCAYSLTKNSTINLSPTASFTAQPENGPPPLVVQFSNQSSNASTLIWKFNDANNSSSTLPAPSFTYSALGDYQVELTATSAQGCADIFSHTIHVIVPFTDVGVEGISLYKDDLTGELRPVITIRNNSNYKVTELDVLVDISGGGVIKEQVTTLLERESSGTIVLSTGIILRGHETYLCAELKLTGDENTANDRDCISLDNTDVILSPYPNPAHGELYMDWIAQSEGSLQFTIFNATGQVAFHQEMTGIRRGLNQLRIDISALSPGMYLILFDDGRSRKSFTQMVN